METDISFCYETKIGTLRISENGYGKITEMYTNDGCKCSKGIETDALRNAAKQINEYLDGKRKTFDIALEPNGTDFQKKVWEELRKVPYGTTVTYGQLAAKIGKPKAARAVGSAMNKNPILIVQPCHRVVGSDGSLTGFAIGLDVKKRLLDLEGVK